MSTGRELCDFKLNGGRPGRRGDEPSFPSEAARDMLPGPPGRVSTRKLTPLQGSFVGWITTFFHLRSPGKKSLKAVH